MVSSEEARAFLERQVERGASLVVASRADLPSIKQLLDQCLDNDIPALLGPCSKGG
jgi:hypothetical protein